MIPDKLLQYFFQSQKKLSLEDYESLLKAWLKRPEYESCYMKNGQYDPNAAMFAFLGFIIKKSGQSEFSLNSELIQALKTILLEKAGTSDFVLEIENSSNLDANLQKIFDAISELNKHEAISAFRLWQQTKPENSYLIESICDINRDFIDFLKDSTFDSAIQTPAQAKSILSDNSHQLFPIDLSLFSEEKIATYFGEAHKERSSIREAATAFKTWLNKQKESNFVENGEYRLQIAVKKFIVEKLSSDILNNYPYVCGFIAAIKSTEDIPRSHRESLQMFSVEEHKNLKDEHEKLIINALLTQIRYSDLLRNITILILLGGMLYLKWQSVTTPSNKELDCDVPVFKGSELFSITCNVSNPKFMQGLKECLMTKEPSCESALSFLDEEPTQFTTYFGENNCNSATFWSCAEKFPRGNYTVQEQYFSEQTQKNSTSKVAYLPIQPFDDDNYADFSWNKSRFEL